jgi:hypothetical protein
VKAFLRGTLTIVLLAAVPAQLACGGSDGKSVDQQIREVEIQSLAAYACMPKNLRRELRMLERRHDARLRALARKNIPQGVTAGTTPPSGFRQTVEADPLRKSLLRRARTIYRRHSPGGADYDPACYLREREKAERRLENVDSTGTAGATN